MEHRIKIGEGKLLRKGVEKSQYVNLMFRIQRNPVQKVNLFQWLTFIS